MQHTLWVLTGPTASDKTEIGFDVARKIDGEIISADSMLFYRGMDIGTAKPSLSMRGRVPHHFIDIIYPWESYSVGKYVKDVEDLIGDISRGTRKFLIVGGSPLYIKGIIDGIFNGPEADWNVRRRLERIAEEKGNLHVHGILQEIDPVKARELHPKDMRRIIRAIEVDKKTGKQVSVLQEQYKKARRSYKFKIMCIAREREDIYQRIDERVDKMFDNGLVDEVQCLLDNPRGLSKQAGQALGYKEVIQYLEGGLTLSGAKELIKSNTRRFSKKQMTWFRSFPDIQWLAAEKRKGLKTVSEKIISILETEIF